MHWSLHHSCTRCRFRLNISRTGWWKIARVLSYSRPKSSSIPTLGTKTLYGSSLNRLEPACGLERKAILSALRYCSLPRFRQGRGRAILECTALRVAPRSRRSRSIGLGPTSCSMLWVGHSWHLRLAPNHTRSQTGQRLSTSLTTSWTHRQS